MGYSPAQIGVGLAILFVIILAGWYVHYKFFFRTCTKDADCPTNWKYPGAWTCQGGQCQPPPAAGLIPCSADADCPAGAKCSGGYCV